MTVSAVAWSISLHANARDPLRSRCTNVVGTIEIGVEVHCKHMSAVKTRIMYIQ
jgi:hypothetical protein